LSANANKSSLTSIVAIIFLIGISAGVYLDKLPEISIVIYIGASLITFLLYGFDKSAAKRGGWRTKESTLHLFSLIGGWPGAMIAQQKFNHKTTKESFRSEFWFTVILNCVAFFWFSSPGNVEKTINFIEKYLM
jgi:uncharacterized membrane protein YsdA (DUF1294 family)